MVTLGCIVTLQQEKGNPLARRHFSNSFFDKHLCSVVVFGRKNFVIQLLKSKIQRTVAAK